MTRTRMGGLLVAALAASVIGVVAAPQQHVPLTDQAIRTIKVLPMSGSGDSIRYARAVRIYNDPLFWNYAIQVDPPIQVIVQLGRVTLSGVVLSEVERRKAEVIA